MIQAARLFEAWHDLGTLPSAVRVVRKIGPFKTGSRLTWDAAALCFRCATVPGYVAPAWLVRERPLCFVGIDQQEDKCA